MTHSMQQKLDMDLFWENVNRILNQELLQISQKVHFFSREILEFEKREEERPKEISEEDCRLALSEAYSELGEALYRLKQPHLAHISFLYAIELDVRNHLAFLHIGVMAGEAGNLPFAIRSLKLSIEINPDYPLSWLELGKLHERAGDVLEAQRSFEKILPNQDFFGESQLCLIRVLSTSGQKEKALTLLEGHRAHCRLEDLHSEMEQMIQDSSA